MSLRCWRCGVTHCGSTLWRSQMRADPAGMPGFSRIIIVLHHCFTHLVCPRNQNTRDMSLKWWWRRPWPAPQDHPFSSLTIYFLFWKALLIGIALMSPGPGYDTSATLLPLNVKNLHENLQVDSALSEGWSKFVRWDAIYFTQISLRGYLFEQEWAFGWGYTKLLSIFMQGITGLDRTSGFSLIGKGLVGGGCGHLWMLLLLPGSLLRTIFISYRVSCSIGSRGMSAMPSLSHGAQNLLL